jgi:1,4-alpha-glucan branching enzyme
MAPSPTSGSERSAAEDSSTVPAVPARHPDAAASPTDADAILSAFDLHLIGRGEHRRLWEVLGAHERTRNGEAGTAFAVWAPHARAVHVVGTFNDWAADRHPLRRRDGGVWEGFVPGVGAGALYKFAITAPDGALRMKTDPLARSMEQGPGHAAIVQPPDTFAWRDDAWIAERARTDWTKAPMLVYEVHLPSWRRVPEEGDRPLSYREIAPRLAEHVTALGFTHVELLPVLEHPYGGSWGYQVGGYYAPTSRLGTPDDFRYFVDVMHAAGIGVLLDWVPAHFPRDDWALRRFDGTACYEHADPRLGDHPEWGTHVFDFGRPQVRGFLLANALYWIEAFHVDGLRVDAVASMLYRDYGREAGAWLRNRFGGNENLEAIELLRALNTVVAETHPGVITVAEESTTWPRVTHPVSEGGLGFTFKWNMGWMHDTLDYFAVDPFFRKGAQDRLTFAMMYEYSERFVNALSHDEVVHLKRSLLGKMPGDAWQRFANLRTLLAYAVTRPGKTMLFMGFELATPWEWNDDASLPWHLLEEPEHAAVHAFVRALGALYREHACFWRADHDPAGFSWIDCSDKEQSVVSYVRRDGDAHAVVVLNLTPVVRHDYRIGAPIAGAYRVALSSDDAAFGGSGTVVPELVETTTEAWHGFEQSMMLTLPPLSAVVLLPERVDAVSPLVTGDGDERQLVAVGAERRDHADASDATTSGAAGVGSAGRAAKVARKAAKQTRKAARSATKSAKRAARTTEGAKKAAKRATQAGKQAKKAAKKVEKQAAKQAEKQATKQAAKTAAKKAPSDSPKRGRKDAPKPGKKRPGRDDG